MDLPLDGTVTYTATGTVLPDAAGTLWNTATVQPPAGVEDPNPGDNEAIGHDPIVRRSADLGVSKTDGIDVVKPRWDLTYTLVITNAGPDEVVGATVHDELPAEQLLAVSWTCGASPGSACDPGSPGQGAVISDQVDLSAGGSVTYTVAATVAPDARGTLSNEVTVSPPLCVADPDLSDNTAADIDQVLYPDCNSNHREDAIDIAEGSSEDVNGDGIPDECQIIMLDWEISGVAQGGEITMTILGFFSSCTVIVSTQAGQDAATVTASLAAVLNADPCLSAQGITAQAHGSLLWVSGFLLKLPPAAFVSTDPGLEHEMLIVKVPTLSGPGLALLILLLAALGGRHRRAGRRST